MEVHYELVGNRIRRRRKELNIQQQEMAEFLNLSNNHISSIENGREKPSLDTLLDICDYLDITPDYVLLGNMHTNDVPLAIIEGLRLCSTEDVEMVREIVEILVERNQKKWNGNTIN